MSDDVTDQPTGDDAEPRDDAGAGIDLGASARQVGLIETGGGVQHGLIAAAIAVGAAIIIVPITRALRAWFRQ